MTNPDNLQDRAKILFEPTSIGPLKLPNRIVMAPMTRAFSPNGVPGPDVAGYYRRRAEGGTGLIMTEGTWIPHPTASNEPNAPRFYGEDALTGWKKVVDDVHAAGGHIMPQLWHVGQIEKAKLENLYEGEDDAGFTTFGPSGMVGSLGTPPTLLGEPAGLKEIEEVIAAYGEAAASAQRLGFDGIELHGAHGYLLDQFNWSVTNLRSDGYGGDIGQRTRFACEVVAEVRRRVGPDYPLVMRMSQWKQHDYMARLADTPQELAQVLEPMAAAGVSAFHCSQRRFWETEFDSDLNLAGWARKITGLPSIAVGSVGLDADFLATFAGQESGSARLDRLFDMMERGDFDMIAVGRALLVDPNWPVHVRNGAYHAVKPYTAEALTTLS